MRQRRGTRKPSDTARRTMPSDEVTMVAARDFLGDLVDKARLLGTRTILSKNGKRAAAIVSMEDYERLTAA